MATAETSDLAPRLAAELEGGPARPQFMTGFDGMAAAPFPEEARKVLAAHVPPEAVEIKPDGIVFVPGVYYRRQLTRAFGAGGWAIVPRGPARAMNDLVIYPGALYCLGRFVAEAVGECTYRQNSNMSYASCVEAAKTDALSRCCKDLGMATELWDAAWREQWKADYAEKYEGEKWDGRAKAMKRATLWRLRSGRPVQDIDLMAGAGAPSVPPKAVDVPKDSTRQSAEAGAASAAPVSPDAGEAATDEQKEEIRGHVKRLGWKGHFAKMWLKGLFGFASPDSLSQDQATNAALLLEAWKTEKYGPLLADMRGEGLVAESAPDAAEMQP